MRTLPNLTLAFALHASTALAAPLTLAVNSKVNGADPSGRAAFVVEVVMAQLGGTPDLTLVDRLSLDKVLEEQGIAKRGITQNAEAASVGRVIGASHFAYFSAVTAGKRILLSCRLVDVETTQFKSVLCEIEDQADPLETGRDLSANIVSALADLEKSDLKWQRDQPKGKVPATLKRPVVALRILESSIGVRPIDPAAEIELTKALLEQEFTAKQLSQASKSVPAGGTGPLEGEQHEKWLDEARREGVEVLIVGEAFSEHAGNLGSLETSRARVEVHAFRTSDGKILCADSGYGVAVDASRLVAGKQAIQQATLQLAIPFLTSLAEAWNR